MANNNGKDICDKCSEPSDDLLYVGTKGYDFLCPNCLTPVAIKFEVMKVADISTAYITTSDCELLAHTDAPGHVMNEDQWHGALFYINSGSTEDNAELVQSQLAYGFSRRFVDIMQAARVQRLDYVRFDADGGEVKGLDHIYSQTTPATERG